MYLDYGDIVGDLHSAGSAHVLSIHVPGNRVGCHGHRLASIGVRLCEILGGGAEHGETGCYGWHLEVCGLYWFELRLPKVERCLGCVELRFDRCLCPFVLLCTAGVVMW